MRAFAKSTVAEVEQAFGVNRESWGRAEAIDTDEVEIFLDEESNPPIYHAFIDVSEPPVFFGDPSEIPAKWLDEASIRFYFGVSASEFAEPDFLERYLE